MDALVGILVGSSSDWEWISQAARTLKDFGVSFETKVLSAHRTPNQLSDYVSSAEARGIRVLIAAAGAAAHLAGSCAAKTTLPVLGVPMPSSSLGGLDALLSTVQMPAGIPVATVAIGKPGATNAALFAVQILALSSPELKGKLLEFRKQQEEKIMSTPALTLD